MPKELVIAYLTVDNFFSHLLCSDYKELNEKLSFQSMIRVDATDMPITHTNVT